MTNKDQNRVLIAGGSGLIGSALSRHLTSKGYQVSILSRNPKKVLNYQAFYWNPSSMEIDSGALSGQDVLINLSGNSIAGKYWTKKRKKSIIESRIKPIQLLQKTVHENQHSLSKIISASAIGYYGHQPGKTLTEKSLPGEGFLSSVCKQWEEETLNLDGNISIIRIGIVLSGRGGYLPKMQGILKKRLNVVFGNGMQYVSWIDIDDLVEAIFHIMKQKNPKPIYNLTSPNPVTTKDLQVNIAHQLGISTLNLNIPEWLVKLTIGQFSEMFLNDTLTIPDALLSENFQFKIPKVTNAL